MDRGNIGRFLLLAAAVLLLMRFAPSLFGNSSTPERQPLHPEGDRSLPAEQRPAEKFCELWGSGFHAQLSTRGASIRKFELTSAKYQKDGKPTQLSTTPEVEARRQLRFQFENPAARVAEADRQLRYDLVDYEIRSSDGKQCEFVYRDDTVELVQTVKTTSRPYELVAEAKLTNLAATPRTHALTVHTDAWRMESEVHGGMFRVSPLLTHVECVASDGTTKRLTPQDFEPADFEKVENFPRTATSFGDWFQAPGEPALAAVSNAYFSHALVPLSGPRPVCQMQIEDRWDARQYQNKGADPHGGAMYRARLAYPAKKLAPGESSVYSVLTYVGPKERSVLSGAAGGNHKLIELIDLGFFSAIAKVLVAFLLKVHSVIPNWGIAIIVLTITARTLLFPLALPGIKGMIKMRELKPEIDALNEKYKDDPQAKGLAQMQLWRKHNVNPVKGCLPQMASMPVWFALYTTLQTAVELYNIPFLWFPDLSAADPLYILPFIIGATSFMQQRLMPIQADPAQQKMMLYFMPAMFTVFMLFLPAGLGVYMFTNGLLGIIQQQAVERYVRRNVRPGGGSGSGDIQVKVLEDSGKRTGEKQGKGSAKQGHPPSGASSSKEDSRLLGEGKA
ncbi:MAG TPA: membrane protein insertase YidC [Polyangiaceae bacterium]|nr:membrane protein insertase YidC [Polyangiaceae bacterium]